MRNLIPLLSAAVLLVAPAPLHAEPRTPHPPWPEQSLSIFGWDEGYWFVPQRQRAIGAEQAVVRESWSGYALTRGIEEATPVAIPALDPFSKPGIAPDSGAVRLWFNPNWSSIGKAERKGEAAGKGPGQPARLLELVNLGGQFPDIRWTLHVNAEGNQLRLTGLELGGFKEMLVAPLDVVADEWRLITLCYSPEGTQLWLDGQLLGAGAGIKAGIAGWEDRLGLIVGSAFNGMEAANGQFEEVVLFDYWPTSEQQQFYYQGVAKQVRLGPVGTPEEEILKMSLVSALDGPPGPPGGGGGGGGGGGTNSPAYNYTTNDLWLKITGKTNTTGYFVIYEPATASGRIYDLFMTTNMSPTVSGLNQTNWLHRLRTTSGQTNLTVASLTAAEGYFQLGTMLDTDGDGLPDAWENLVTHSENDTVDTDGDGLADVSDPQPLTPNGPASFAGKSLPFCPQ
jgi:hypothetical protein